MAPSQPVTHSETWIDHLDVLRMEVLSAFAHRALWEKVTDAFPDSIVDEPEGPCVIHFSMINLALRNTLDCSVVHECISGVSPRGDQMLVTGFRESRSDSTP